MNDYDKLITYYRQCFNLIDCFHFNSEIACNVYSNYITPNNSKVIPITHAGIKDHRTEKIFDDKILRIGFTITNFKYHRQYQMGTVSLGMSCRKRKALAGLL